ncbi:MAG: SRPBCC family protein [Gemmatimonadetes bacterium]|nr:SRPBCC family protein [Gemmatimonadota bacterium]
MYELKTEQLIPLPLDEVFAFFADASNLSRITPPWLDFRIVSETPVRMEEGRLIDYRLKVHGFPLRWQSEITVWDPPHRFVDEQRKGPYKVWHHTHRFEKAGNGTRVIDEVRYDVPGGALIHKLIVKRDIAKIFEYRVRALEELFGAPETGTKSA